jgi:galactonate dehydratase
MVDLHGMPWMTTRDAISMGRRLEEFGVFFYEEPVAPENVEALARVSEAINIPLAAGERLAYIYGARELIEREIVDVIQPDAGRFGGLAQMKKLAGMAEAHYIQFAPHDGSLGPVGEIASIHLCATLPNFLIWEHRTGDVQARYEVMAPQTEVVDSYIAIPEGPGLGVDLVDEEIERYACDLLGGHSSYAEDNTYDSQYVYARFPRKPWLE